MTGSGRGAFRLSYAQTIALGFLLLIALGTLLLSLPLSARDGAATPLLPALFTATSAPCVTGLVVYDTYTHWSLFGQCVLLLLIQTGGLGFMTIAVFFFMLLNRRIGLRQREVLSESLNNTQIGGILRLSRKIVAGTALCEGVGAALLALRFVPRYGAYGAFMALFHSVSAFCNAGFDLMGIEAPYSSFTLYAGDALVNGVLMALIVVGGLGFLVWDEITVKKWRLRRYTLHSKVVLSVTLLLLLGGAALFWLFEENGTGAAQTPGTRALSAAFSAVTARTAGFNTVDTAALTPAGKLLTMLLMFIGGSPGSTAGGVKTTTAAVALLYALSFVRADRSTAVFGRQLELDALRKANAVLLTNFLLALSAAVLLCQLQPLSVTDALFETFSAVGTVGMSTGITRALGTASRLVIILLMFCGRVGSVSFASALTARRRPAPVGRPRENITIG